MPALEILDVSTSQAKEDELDAIANDPLRVAGVLSLLSRKKRLVYKAARRKGLNTKLALAAAIRTQ